MQEIKCYLERIDREAALAQARARGQTLSSWVRGVVSAENKRRLDRRSLEEVVLEQLGPVINRMAEEALQRAFDGRPDLRPVPPAVIVSPYGGLAFLEDSDAIEEAQ